MAKITIQQVNETIMFGDFTNDQLDSIYAAIKYRKGQLVRSNVRTLSQGINVRFTSNRTGQTIAGTVLEVKIKNVIVQTAQGRYRVPANMLEVV